MKVGPLNGVLMIVLAGLLPACTGIAGGVQPEEPQIPQLNRLAADALVRARGVAPDAVLRQLDIVWATGQEAFRFTDGDATKEITVLAPAPGGRPDQWQVMTPELSPLADHHPGNGLNLQTLEVGPTTAAQVFRRQRPDVAVLSMLLRLADDGATLQWVVFGSVPGGEISGQVNALTGAFQALGPGLDHPAVLPLTASPRPT